MKTFFKVAWWVLVTLVYIFCAVFYTVASIDRIVDLYKGRVNF